MERSAEDKGRNFTAFRPAAEEAATKGDHDTMKGEQQVWDTEGGHMSLTGGSIKRVSDSQLPYLVTLAHHGGQPSENAFSTMREAKAYIKRNTPLPGAILSTTYERPASEPQTSASPTESDERRRLTRETQGH